MCIYEWKVYETYCIETMCTADTSRVHLNQEEAMTGLSQMYQMSQDKKSQMYQDQIVQNAKCG